MKLRVSGSDIKIVRDELIVTEAIGCYIVEFQFDKNWNEMINKTAVIYQPTVNRDNPIYLIIDENNKIKIPLAALTAEDFLYIGVFGFTADGEVRLPTIFTYTYVKRGCYERSKEPVPDPSVYEQIYLMALKAVEIAMSVREDADAGKFDGFSPTITVKVDTSNTYILTITTKDGSFDTPNLIAENTGDLTYIHDQTVASDTWIVNHDLKKYPSVTIVDSAKTAIYGEITYTDLNSLTISFSSPFAGMAYCN